MARAVTIAAQFIATCDECHATFEDGTYYVTFDDLVHDLRVSGWETSDNAHLCVRCVRIEREDRPYQGPPQHHPSSPLPLGRD